MNKKLLLWSIIVALGGFLFGFDTAVISGAEQSIQRFWSLTSFQHGLTVSIALIGTVVLYLLIYIAFFAFSQGAVIWVFISEIFPNQVRAKGQSLGSFSHWFMNAIISGLFPLMAVSSGG